MVWGITLALLGPLKLRGILKGHAFVLLGWKILPGWIVWLKGGKKEKKKKNQVRAISALESSLSKKIMKWEKGRNMPCGSQKDKRKHQSLANKKQTMAWSQSASFGQSCLWRWVGSIGHCRIEPWLLQEQGLLLLLSWMRSGPALLCFPPGKLSCFAQGHQTSCQQICLHCCHRFRLP